MLGGRLGSGSRCWQGRRLDQPGSLSSGLSQQPPGSHLPGCRNGYVGTLLLHAGNYQEPFSFSIDFDIIIIIVIII